ncbi:MAG TPA: hypothetical protein VGM90_37520 [Kofleriaceae bacterium]|jgi:hypothetical protein
MMQLRSLAEQAGAPLAAIAATICALELLVMRRALSERGVFAWSVLRDEWGPLRPLASLVYAESGILVVIALQLASALALPFTAHAPHAIAAAPAWIATIATLLISVRFRGTYNGGSDSMLLVVLGAHAVIRTWPGTSIAQGAATYVIAQLVLSYFIAGVAKLGDPAWRTGRALAILVTLPQYRVPPAIANALSRPSIGRIATLGMLALECAFPLALLDSRAALVFVAAGGLFHAMNAEVFGLNRFWWAWLAAYPFLLAR